MDRRPTLETRPPVLIDAVVRMVIPPACREHVVGDLWERYRSPARYMIDAAQTVPFVVISQIRRTSTVGAVLIQAFVMFVGFAAKSGGAGRAVAPVVAGILALVLRDAYRTCISISAKHVGVDLIAGVGGVFISQAIIAATSPHLMLTMPGYGGGLVSFGMLYLLRLQNPTLGAVPRQTVARVPATLDALVTEVRLYERMSVRARRIEALAGIALAGFFTLPLMSSPNWPLRIGWALSSAYGLYVAVLVSWYGGQRMPEGLGFGDSVAHYRRELVRQHGWVRTMWFWYLMPCTPALFFLMVGGAVAASERGKRVWPAVVVLGVVASVGVIGHMGSRDMARKLRVRIDALGTAEEQSR